MRMSDIIIELECEEDTLILGRALAQTISAGDVVFLTGQMGAGKSALARAAIQSLNPSGLAVPSPSFTLVYPYSDGHKSVYHADLYRLTDPEEVYELGLADCLNDHALLIEWPEKGAGHLPAQTLTLNLSLIGATQRRLSIRSHDGALCASLELNYKRQKMLAQFLLQNGLAEAHVQHIAGDASSRRYLRITRHDQEAPATYVLMDWPHGPDGPAVYKGEPYSKIARLAEATPQFCAMVRHLKEIGLSAPHIYAADEDAGLILLEDFGAENLQDMARDNPMLPVCLAEAVATLSALHCHPAAPFLHTYDAHIIWFETTLFLDWYLPGLGIEVTEPARKAWEAMWRDISLRCLSLPHVTVLRDFHSPNLLWLPMRQSVQRIGLIDVQDALAGSPAYDLASLLQDARVDMDEVYEAIGLSRYYDWQEMDPKTIQQFRIEYDILGVQRNLKIAGIFHRLARRDGKPHYLKHMPRIEGYLRRGLSRPALAPLRVWLNTYARELGWHHNEG